MNRTATISYCNQYRYSLSRCWDNSRDVIVFLMLNPSSADGLKDDPTIRKCIGFAKQWRYGGIIVVNLFAWRTTDPAKLSGQSDPVGPENDNEIRSACAGRVVICAWGANRIAADRAKTVYRIIRPIAARVFCLRLTKSGFPQHPLYVPYTAGAVEFSPLMEVRP